MRLPVTDYLIVSCEHGGNRVPPRWKGVFSERTLQSHRGWDPGALELAREVARAAHAPLFHSTTSRLLVDLNRPLGHPQLFIHPLPDSDRRRLLERQYLPYWRSVERVIARARGRVLHLSVHSFTPRLRGERRTTDIGLLFDPRRGLEAAFCRAWRKAILETSPRLRVRNNDPYRGTFPSLVEAMRRKFGPRKYVGVQIEVNQRYARGARPGWNRLRRRVVDSFVSARLAQRC